MLRGVSGDVYVLVVFLFVATMISIYKTARMLCSKVFPARDMTIVEEWLKGLPFLSQLTSVAEEGKETHVWSWIGDSRFRQLCTHLYIF